MDFLAVQTEGKRQVERNLKHYNLDAIISVGYRVSSKRAVQFRQWATQRLTGFDAPSMHTLYIDKPMKGHNLMQAIARVNRVHKDKPGGLVVDYLGISVPSLWRNGPRIARRCRPMRWSGQFLVLHD